MKVKPTALLTALLMVAFALTRVPGLFPPNFSAVYGLLFCTGVFIPGRRAWWLPLGTLLATDLLLNCYYQFALGWDVFTGGGLLFMGVNYLVYPLLIGLGRWITARASWFVMLGGGLLGAILFYFITNTASWFLNPFGNPEYTHDLAGWLRALSQGTGGWPHTWEFFRNTLTSGGLFTGLFAGAMKLLEAAQPDEEEEESPTEEPAEGEAEEAK